MPQEEQKPTKLYPRLIRYGLVVFVISLVYYAVLVPSPAEPSALAIASYYALVGLSMSLLMGAVLDYSVHSSHLALDARLTDVSQRVASIEEKLDRLARENDE